MNTLKKLTAFWSDNKPLFACVGLFAVVLTLSIVLTCVINAPEKDEDDVTDKTVYSTENYTYRTDISSVADVLNTTSEEFLLLANKQNPLGEFYIPENLVQIDNKYIPKEDPKEIELVGAVNTAAAALMEEMRAHGFTTVSITSAYRSYAYQQSLYYTYYDREEAANPSWTPKQIKAEVLTYSAYPGTSEHQSGLCIDFIDYGAGMEKLVNYGSDTEILDDIGFAETSAYAWLVDNAHKFGFILRFPQGKESITGYNFESWHYRFVGVDAATKIYNEGITLEEFLEG